MGRERRGRGMGFNGSRRPVLKMRRGDIRIVDLEPVVGSEANKQRPAVIVSNDGANLTAARLGRGVLTIVPLTTSTARVHPFQILLEADAVGLREDCKAQAEQVRSVDVERIGARVGSVPAHLMDALDEALRLHLAL
jgi:mRNA interferase MazF